MFHLFDKVYLVNDALINVNFDRVVISQEYGLKMYEALDKVAGGYLFAYGTSIDEVLSGSSFVEFIQTLKNKTQESNKKIIIYADDINFSKFLSMWFKSIFINISFEDAWRIVSDYINKEKFFKNYRMSSVTTQLDIFTLLTEKQFSTDFTDAASYDLGNLSQLLSVELLLANFITTGTYKEELKSSIKKILTRSLTEIAIEVKCSFVKNFNKSHYPNLAKDFEFFSNSSIYTAQSLGQVSTINNVVNLQTATEFDITKFKNISSHVLLEWEQIQPQSATFSLINFVDMIRKDNISDSDLQTIIEFEKSALGTTRSFSSSDEEKLNIYFLDHILNALPETLSGYALK
jgi:hypothetical protein